MMHSKNDTFLDENGAVRVKVCGPRAGPLHVLHMSFLLEGEAPAWSQDFWKSVRRTGDFGCSRCQRSSRPRQRQPRAGVCVFSVMMGASVPLKDMREDEAASPSEWRVRDGRMLVLISLVPVLLSGGKQTAQTALQSTQSRSGTSKIDLAIKQWSRWKRPPSTGTGDLALQPAFRTCPMAPPAIL